MVNGVYTFLIPSILLNLVMLEPVKIFVSTGFNSNQRKNQKTMMNQSLKIQLSCGIEIDSF